eukprot:scaffold30797_cov146-Isochrysis_galbana.AAC.2
MVSDDGEQSALGARTERVLLNAICISDPRLKERVRRLAPGVHLAYVAHFMGQTLPARGRFGCLQDRVDDGAAVTERADTADVGTRRVHVLIDYAQLCIRRSLGSGQAHGEAHHARSSGSRLSVAAASLDAAHKKRLLRPAPSRQDGASEGSGLDRITETSASAMSLDAAHLLGRY